MIMMTSTKNETKSRFDETISYKSLYFVKPSLELEPLFTERWGKSFSYVLCDWSVWRSHDGEADDDNEDDDDDDDDDDDNDDDDDKMVAMIMIIWRVWVEFVVGSLPCSERFFCG